ncbi:MAG: DUF2851 family protein [Breznakibacter sp.]
MINEELLHFVWKYRLFDPSTLITSDGQAVEVIHPGTHNHDAGPDFFNAKMKIGETLWAGNVEMHVKASDWNRHGHHQNGAYNNVVLHVVRENDVPVTTQNRRIVPAMVLEVSPKLLEKYKELVASEKWLVCQDVIGQVNPLEISGWLECCMVSRMEERSLKIGALLAEFNGDWDQVFFILLARSYGFGTNSEPFELMGRQTPFKVLMHHADSPTQVEAVLLGQAGLLNSLPQDDYQKQLQREYRFLSNKFGLNPIEGHLWKFLRLRPMNFPTVRLAQLAAFVIRSRGTWDNIIKQENHQRVMAELAAPLSGYWESHYLLGEASEMRPKTIGPASRQLILVNAIVPFLFAYGAHRGNENMKSRALEWLEALPAEKNRVLENWKVYGGFSPANAFEAQALIYLHRHFCTHKKCLHCRIGLTYLAKKELS